MNNSETKASGKLWVLLVLVLLASVGSTMALFKVPPVMGLLMEEFQIGATQGGLIMSIFSIIPIFLSIPAGLLAAKFGNWKLGLVALICLIVGALIGVNANSLPPLLLSRVIEGVALTLFGTIGPIIVNQLFPPQHREHQEVIG